ncbi:MAG TPA: hypothetical protein VFW96_26050, partial [Thermomicrobiales bacterium]|nr:hypothetical protein [Thermomicrobiales bacterium]
PGPRAAGRAQTTPARNWPGSRESGHARQDHPAPPTPAARTVARPATATAAERPTADPAPACCARAVAAAVAYDRRATLAAFADALARDPAVRPSLAPGFWEMPSGGHADLARAYLRCGRPRDARSVLTVALLACPHQRELEALQRETAGALDRAS